MAYMLIGALLDLPYLPLLVIFFNIMPAFHTTKKAFSSRRLLTTAQEQESGKTSSG
jgi:hypothetical protein